MGANQERILLPLRTNPLASLLHGWVDGKKAERGEGEEGREQEQEEEEGRKRFNLGAQRAAHIQP